MNISASRAEEEVFVLPGWHGRKRESRRRNCRVDEGAAAEHVIEHAENGFFIPNDARRKNTVSFSSTRRSGDCPRRCARGKTSLGCEPEARMTILRGSKPRMSCGRTTMPSGMLRHSRLCAISTLSTCCGQRRRPCGRRARRCRSLAECVGWRCKAGKNHAARRRAQSSSMRGTMRVR